MGLAKTIDPGKLGRFCNATSSSGSGLTITASEGSFTLLALEAAVLADVVAEVVAVAVVISGVLTEVPEAPEPEPTPLEPAKMLGMMQQAKMARGKILIMCFFEYFLLFYFVKIRDC